ncbi:hypothetical protein H4218_002659 [Coemansia sp. IMI 209128]|nr:hypothetical protein H4218_002659 [Coemansia sp. IMI 209128]
MRHQLQIPLYLAKLCAGPVADTAVAALAALCLLTSKRPKLGIAYKQPVTFAVSLANVTLLLSSVTNFTGRVAASVAATLALSMCSGVNVSRGNLLSYLHVVRAVNAAFDLTLLSLPAAAASALAHLFTAWQLLDDGAKAHAKRGLYDMFGVRGFALVMLGKRRPFAVEDIRDPAEEEEFYQKSKRLCDDRSKR